MCGKTGEELLGSYFQTGRRLVIRMESTGDYSEKRKGEKREEFSYGGLLLSVRKGEGAAS